MGGSVSAGSIDARYPPTFDPNYGFTYERKERELPLTEQQMIEAKIPLRFRDYCSHYLADFYKCRRKAFPRVWRCAHEMHEWENCQKEDTILRMKEFEREKRLLARQERKAAREHQE